MDKWMVSIELSGAEYRQRYIRNLSKRQARKLAEEVVSAVTSNEYTMGGPSGHLFCFPTPSGELHYLRLPQVVAVSAEPMPSYMLDDEPKTEEKPEEAV